MRRSILLFPSGFMSARPRMIRRSLLCGGCSSSMAFCTTYIRLPAPSAALDGFLSRDPEEGEERTSGRRERDLGRQHGLGMGSGSSVG